MFSKFLIALLVALLGAACAEKSDSEGVPVRAVVSEDTITALLACVVPNLCLLPGDVQSVNRETIYGVTFADGGTSVKYFFTDTPRFGVSITFSPTRRILLEDEDLDGVVDRITQSVEADPTKVVVYGRENPKWPVAQGMYLDAMGVAVSKVIPPALLESVKRLREEERKPSI